MACNRASSPMYRKTCTTASANGMLAHSSCIPASSIGAPSLEKVILTINKDRRPTGLSVGRDVKSSGLLTPPERLTVGLVSLSPVTMLGDLRSAQGRGRETRAK